MKAFTPTLFMLFLGISLCAQGNVGIGTTSPQNRLDIRDDGISNTPTILLGLSSNTSNRPMIQFSEDATASPTTGMSIEYNGWGTGGNNKLHINGADQNPKFTVMNSGYTGIGTATSDRELYIFDVGDNGDAILELEATTGGAKAFILGINQSTGGLLGTTSNTNLTFRTNNSTRMTITNDGEVGINTGATHSMLTLRGPNNTTTGPIITLYGNGSDQAESGRIRFVESTSSSQWRGGYIRYDGSANRFHIGVHNDSDNNPANDNDAISINRGNGDVGIGTPNPAQKLHIYGGNMIMDRGVTTSGLTRVMEIEGARNACCSDFARIDFRNIDSDDQNVEYVGARISSANVFGDDSGYLYFYVADNYNSLDLRQMISANPNIGALFWSDLETEGSITPMTDDSYDLGSPSYRWDDVWATNAFIQTSDRRDKIDVRRLDYGLNSIMALQPVRFNWLDKQGAGEKLGLIAQDVMQVIPEVVVTTNTVTDLQTGETTTEDVERLGMRYADLIPVLINAIQEQQTMITDLQEENSAIRSKLERLEKSLTSTAAAN